MVSKVSSTRQPPLHSSSIQKKEVAYKLKPSDEKAIKAWAKRNLNASISQIQDYVQNTFGIRPANRTIYRHKRAWGFAVPPSLPAMSNDKVTSLKAWAKDNNTATTKEIQDHIKDTLGVTYAERTIRTNRKAWGFTAQAPALLSDDKVTSLKAWAKDNKTSTVKEIQNYIEKTLGIKYSETFINRHRKAWGFTKRVQTRSLTPDEVKTIQNWAKNNQSASNEHIQGYIKKTFGIEYILLTVQRLKKIWGFAIKAYKARKNRAIKEKQASIEKELKSLKVAKTSLSNANIETLKAWAKEHKNATNKDIQDYIESSFRIEFSEVSIQECKEVWGFNSEEIDPLEDIDSFPTVLLDSLF